MEYVSTWARRAVGDDEDEPKNVTPGRPPRRGDRSWLRDTVDAWHAGLREQHVAKKQSLYKMLAVSLSLLVVSQLPDLPSAMHWLAFFGAIGTGSKSIKLWQEMLSLRTMARMNAPELTLMTTASSARQQPDR